MDQETTRNLIDYLVNRHGYDYLTAALTASDLSEWYDDTVGDTVPVDEHKEALLYIEAIKEDRKYYQNKVTEALKVLQ